MSGGPGRTRVHLATLTNTLNRRVKDIFPAFDSNSGSTSWGDSYNTLKPDQLYRTLTDNYRSNNHVEHTIVKSAWFCKQEKSVGHEFIIVEVEDTLLPNGMLTNYLVLDRNKGAPQHSSLGSTSKLVPKFLRSAARDAFRVSHDGNLERLVKDCQLDSYEYLEQIKFERDRPLMLYELATLTHRISDLHPRYTFMDANCFWFAGLIWDCMIKMRPDANHVIAKPNKRGKFGLIRYKKNVIQVKRMCDRVQEDVSRVTERLSNPVSA
ncbi:hypothetical protein CTheo_7196 [Ceratobasidium theobromae]|uniref:Uncharacterized protein n=1 Tax=Ceratobasidium theobromae TaxID=1582974 RepID=A0A5N5QD31_9AGAM|nr:hypothetical protein CTheo_7196 [Ceratobasidium theobromae]